MRTAEEKAKELVDKFEPLTRQFDNDEGWIINLQDAKQCAIIAVDEIINAIKLIEKDYHEGYFSSDIAHYQSVKEEIINL